MFEQRRDMGSWLRIFGIFSVLIFSFDVKVGDLFPISSNSPNFDFIYIIQHSWHTGIVLSGNILEDEISILNGVYPNAEYIEIGWGDLDFFTSEKGTIGKALKAVLWPTRSVLRVFPYQNDPSVYIEKDKLIKLQIPAPGIDQLLRYIEKSFALDESSQIIPIQNETADGGKFFLSVEKYHLFKTCNVWTSKAIKTAGYPMVPFYALTSKNVFRQIRKQLR